MHFLSAKGILQSCHENEGKGFQETFDGEIQRRGWLGLRGHRKVSKLITTFCPVPTFHCFLAEKPLFFVALQLSKICHFS